jgi:hypothetical protein
MVKGRCSELETVLWDDPEKCLGWDDSFAGEENELRGEKLRIELPRCENDPPPRPDPPPPPRDFEAATAGAAAANSNKQTKAIGVNRFIGLLL